MTDPESSPLDALADAVQAFAVHQAGKPVLVDNALVIWELVSLDEDGNAARAIRYAVPSDNFTLSGSLGLLEAAGEYVRRDIIGSRGDGADE